MTAIQWHALQNGSDIRGVALDGVPDEAVNLTPDVVLRLGQAFAQWLGQTLAKPIEDCSVAVGRDSRVSGPKLMEALTQGLAQSGCDVRVFGLASTPAMFMSTVTPELDCDGAIMLTASHLPFNRNGLKFFTRTGGLDKADIRNILTLAEQGALSTTATPGSIQDHNFMATYAAGLVQRIRESVQHPTQFDQPLRGLKIIVDAGNGAGGFFVDQVLQPLGAETAGSQFLEPDGMFPNHIPNPEDKTAIASIRQAVVDTQADLGIIFDTDVDRSGAVDGSGQELNRNRLIALMSAIVLQEHPGSTIVTDSITSEGLTQFIESDLQGKHHRFRRGYKNVINEAVRLNEAGGDCWLAIETSGHGAMRENYFLDDGAFLISKVLIELAKAKLAGKSLLDRLASLKEPQGSQECRLKILRPDFQAYGNDVIAKLTAFADHQPNWSVVPNNYEGIRVACAGDKEQGWFLLRLSLHDPVLPLNIESNLPGGVEQIAQQLMAFFDGIDDLDLVPLKAAIG